jgi:hypothetical protein
VIKNVDKVANQIRSVNIITRNVLKEDCRSANLRIQDWYTYGDNEYYEKVENLVKINKFEIFLFFPTPIIFRVPIDQLFADRALSLESINNMLQLMEAFQRKRKN